MSDYAKLCDSISTEDTLDIEKASSDETPIPFTKVKRHWGRHKVFFGFKGSEPYFSIGPNWLHSLIALGSFAIFGALTIQLAIKNLPLWMVGVTSGVVAWQIIIFSITSLRNPGIASNPKPTTKYDFFYRNNPSFCTKCKVLMTLETVHCIDCDVCIGGYDHHCIWTGKCIAKNNLKAFYCFLVSSVLFFMYCIFVCVQALYFDMKKNKS